MKAVLIVVLVLVALAVVAAIVLAVTKRKRTARLKGRFGDEYDRTLDRADGRKEAEIDLRDRLDRHESLEIRTLPDAARLRYLEVWDTTQARFVDDPVSAVRDADDLIGQVMRERGYPVDDFEQRAADVSVDHPDVVEQYRAGHDIVERHRRGDGSTEDMRKAMLHHRALFERLLEPSSTTTG